MESIEAIGSYGSDLNIKKDHGEKKSHKVHFAKNSSTYTDSDVSYFENLTVNSHFFNTPVDLNISSVHLPTYVYDQSKSIFTFTIVL